MCSAACLPTTALTTRRCSGANATWSQQSPHQSSASSARSQCFSFLATKDHFSSNCTSRVRGGKSHEFVVELLGVVAGPQGVADDGVLADADQPAGLADADALLEVGQDRGGLVGGQAAAEERGALALGEAGLAGAAVQQAAPLLAVAAAGGEVAVAALAVVGAVGVLAAEAAQVVIHGGVLRGGRAGCRSAAVVLENA